MKRVPLLFSLFLVASLSVAAPQAAGQACPTEPTYDPAITPPSVAIPSFTKKPATAEELAAYAHQVDAESDRVITASFGTTVGDRELVYSMVSTPGNLADLDQIVTDELALRDPETSASEAAEIAASSPAIVWYAANVHGGETSGGDAAASILYDLAARTDCEVGGMLEDLVVGIVPSQNPDGRDALTRRNLNGFDLNRDWLTWTQPETKAKIDLLVQYPPVLFIDAHEMGYSSFFFPPNADPIYHEISEQSVHWINDIYGTALASAFDANRQGNRFDYWNYGAYDLFYMGYGDTVPTTMFTAAGMTFEKGAQDQYQQRYIEHFVAGWASLEAAGVNKQDILSDYRQAYLDAVDQGAAGDLEPNQVYQPGNTVDRDVPDMSVRSYFVSPSRAYGEVARLIGRLLEAGVHVYRLDEDLAVSDLHPYGRPAASGTVPAGSFWIPMDQPQKHWIQAMMNEDTYVPFPYFYDVTAWSNPLLANLDASFTGEEVAPSATEVTSAPEGGIEGTVDPGGYLWFPGDDQYAVVAALALAREDVAVTRLAEASGGLPSGAFVAPASAAGAVAEVAEHFGVLVHPASGTPPSGLAFEQPRIALYSGGGESAYHIRFLFGDVWELSYDRVGGQAIKAGALSDYDVFVVPGVSASYLNHARKQIEDWIASGGVFVGTARPGGTGGTALAVRNGWTSSALSSPAGFGTPGAMFRVALDGSSPVTLGAPAFSYWYDVGEQVMSPTITGANAGLYPTTAPDFFVSGYATGEDALKGSTALVDETLGDGHVVLFSGEPNYRAFTGGPELLLANALVYPAAFGAAGVDVTSAAAASAVSAAMASAGAEMGPGAPIRIEVPAKQANRARAVILTFTQTVKVERSGGSAFLTIPNAEDLDVEEHPFALELLPALSAAGVEVRSAIL